MTKKFILFPIIGLLFLTSGCTDNSDSTNITFNEDGVEIISNPEYGSWQNLENKQMEFELVGQVSFEEVGEIVISGINYLSQGPEENLYFFDRQQNKLNSITPSGDIRWSVGQTGRGPGDFENVSDIKVVGSNILVSNIQGTRLDFFDLNGEFKRSIQLPDEVIFAKIVGESSDGEIIISSVLRGQLGVNVFFINANLEAVRSQKSFPISQGPELEVKVGVGLDAELNLRDGKLYSGNTSFYEIGVYSMDGELLQKITREFNKMVRPGIISTGNFNAIRTFGELSSPYFFNNGSFIIISNWPENIEDPDEYLDKVQNNTAPDVIRANSLDYYSKDGKLLNSIENTGFYPEIGNVQFVNNDIIYTLKGLTINKFVLKIEIK